MPDALHCVTESSQQRYEVDTIVSPILLICIKGEHWIKKNWKTAINLESPADQHQLTEGPSCHTNVWIWLGELTEGRFQKGWIKE